MHELVLLVCARAGFVGKMWGTQVTTGKRAVHSVSPSLASVSSGQFLYLFKQKQKVLFKFGRLCIINANTEITSQMIKSFC